MPVKIPTCREKPGSAPYPCQQLGQPSTGCGKALLWHWGAARCRESMGQSSTGPWGKKSGS